MKLLQLIKYPHLSSYIVFFTAQISRKTYYITEPKEQENIKLLPDFQVQIKASARVYLQTCKA